MRKLGKHETTFAVSDTGNTVALCMCLSSVLNARYIPHRIQILCQGPFPAFANFYLEQLAEWARLSGVEWSLNVSAPLGLRGARDWHLDHCQTRFMWMGDNDVVYSPDCLEMLGYGWDREYAASQIYVQGTKSDVNNRRGYKDFVSECLPRTAIQDFCSANMRYMQLTLEELNEIRFNGIRVPTTDITTIDTGNVLFDVEKMDAYGFRFKIFPDSLNTGGEDTLMALIMRKRGCVGRLMPWAASYHLEKENAAFDEITARGEMLLRLCDQLGLDKELLKKGFAPWVWSEQETYEKNQQEETRNETQSIGQAIARLPGVYGRDPREEGKRRKAKDKREASSHAVEGANQDGGSPEQAAGEDGGRESEGEDQSQEGESQAGKA